MIEDRSRQKARPKADPGTALFAYGSLLDASQRRALLGREVDTIAARLIGYERRRSRHFYVIQREGSETKGQLMLGMTASDLELLDRYEEVPRLYTRERAEVVNEAGQTIRCWLYLPTTRLLKG